MIGRVRELDVLLAQVDAACALRHKQNVVFVTGEAGIGKTTLIQSFRDRLEARRGAGAPVIAATECSTPLLGQDVGQMEALEPWADLLEDLVRRDDSAKNREMVKLVSSVARAWVHVIPVVGGVIASGLETAVLLSEGGEKKKGHAASQEQMFQQYINFLAKASEAHPLVLVLDDFHWADTSSTNLLFSAARHLASKPVLFVVAYRADDAASSRGGQGHPLIHVRNELGRYSQFMDLVVPKMTPRDLDSMLRARYTHYHENDDFERWLAERSGGNALFITQYLNTLEEDGIVSPQTGEFLARFDAVRVPNSAFSVVEERIRRLDDEDRELLRYASVEGATFTTMVLSRTAELSRMRLLQRLRLIAEKHEVIKSLGKERVYASETTAFQFTNVLLQRALYESLEDEERDSLHATIFSAVRDDWDAAADRAVNVAGIATRLSAHARSADERTLAARLLLAAARTSWSRFAEEETLGLLAAMRGHFEAMAGDEAKSLDGEARLLTGLVHKFRGRHDPALESFRASARLLEDAGDPRRALEPRMREAFALENARRLDDAEARSQEVLARAEALSDERVRAAMLNNLGLVLTARGDHTAALEHQRASLELREKIGDVVGQAVTLGSVGLALFSAGRNEEALEHHRKALELREKLDDRMGQGFSLANVGAVLSASGRLEEALDYVRRSVAVREAIGDVVGQAASLENEARILRDLGREEEAQEREARVQGMREMRRERRSEAAPRATNEPPKGDAPQPAAESNGVAPPSARGINGDPPSRDAKVPHLALAAAWMLDKVDAVMTRYTGR